jgi:hypothetical protein
LEKKPHAETRQGEEASSSGRRDWRPELPSLSGDLCAKALIWLGWIPIAWSRGLCLLVRSGERIFIPRAVELDHQSVDRLIRQAAVTPLEFIEALECLCEQDIQEMSVRRARETRRLE